VILFGTITAIAHGVMLPLQLVVFGRVTDSFSNQYLSRQIASEINSNPNNITVSVNNLNCTELNIICNTTERETCGFFVDNSLCTTSDDLIDEINIFVIYFCANALAAFICGWLHISLYQYACERQLNIIRKKFFRSILRQEVGWFDVNSVGELNTRLNE